MLTSAWLNTHVFIDTKRGLCQAIFFPSFFVPPPSPAPSTIISISRFFFYNFHFGKHLEPPSRGRVQYLANPLGPNPPPVHTTDGAATTCISLHVRGPHTIPVHITYSTTNSLLHSASSISTPHPRRMCISRHMFEQSPPTPVSCVALWFHSACNNISRFIFAAAFWIMSQNSTGNLRPLFKQSANKRAAVGRKTEATAALLITWSA